MAKLARKMYAQFVTLGTPEAWAVLGVDNDDLKKEMSPQTETKKNVLGEQSFVHNGYESKVTVEPYYANPSDPFYEKLLDIVMLESNAEAKCLGKYAEVVFTTFDETTKIATGTAYVQDAWFVPQSIGGDTSGVQIPFEINPVGARIVKDVSYNAATHAATFTVPEP